MHTQITSRHFKADPELREYVEQRVGKLERYFDGITDARVILDIHENSVSEKLAEISLNVHRHTLTAREKAPTHKEAIQRCMEDLRRQVLRYKDKSKDKTKDVHH